MAFCVLCTLEEISWGQRILGTESPEFFLTHNIQQETNLHNVFRQWTGVKTREIAAPVLFLYGALLPLARLGSGRRPPGRVGPERFRLPLPPAYLSVGFTLGAGISWFDAPTGHEEEIGEYMLSLCLALFMLSEWLSAQRPAGDHAPSR